MKTGILLSVIDDFGQFLDIFLQVDVGLEVGRNLFRTVENGCVVAFAEVFADFV
jgi:hypothetical protein